MMQGSEKAVKKIVFGDSGAEIIKVKSLPVDPKEVLVKVNCSLISIGTEMTVYNNGENDKYKTETMLGGRGWDIDGSRQKPGYIVAGDVVETGIDVNDFIKGDRVVSLVSHGDYVICPTDPWYTLKIPENVSYEEAALSVIASVSLHGIRKANISLGEDVVVFGAGLVGLFALKFAKMSGAYPLISVDISPERLKFARDTNVELTINPNIENIVDVLSDYIGPGGVSCIIEATGNAEVLKTAFKIASPGAKIITMGALVKDVMINLQSEFIWKELNLIAAQQPRNPIQTSIYYRFTQQKDRQLILELMNKKILKTDGLITHRYHYSKAPEIYKLLAGSKVTGDDRKGNMVGVLFDWND